MTTAIAPRNGHAPVARAKQSALIEVFQVLHVGVGFRVTPETERAFELILSGYEPDVLRFAALEYVRQRKVAPENAGALVSLRAGCNAPSKTRGRNTRSATGRHGIKRRTSSLRSSSRRAALTRGGSSPRRPTPRARLSRLRRWTTTGPTCSAESS